MCYHTRTLFTCSHSFFGPEIQPCRTQLDHNAGLLPDPCFTMTSHPFHARVAQTACHSCTEKKARLDDVIARLKTGMRELGERIEGIGGGRRGVVVVSGKANCGDRSGDDVETGSRLALEDSPAVRGVVTADNGFRDVIEEEEEDEDSEFETEIERLAQLESVIMGLLSDATIVKTSPRIIPETALETIPESDNDLLGETW